MNFQTHFQQKRPKRPTSIIIDFIGNDQQRMEAFVEFYQTADQYTAQHCSTVIHHLVDQNPTILQPFFEQLYAIGVKANQHKAVLRHTLRMFALLEIPKSLESELLQRAFDLLTDKEEPIAVRVFAMTILSKLMILYPAISSELKSLILLNFEQESAGFRSRGRKVLASIEKLQKVKHSNS